VPYIKNNFNKKRSGGSGMLWIELKLCLDEFAYAIIILYISEEIENSTDFWKIHAKEN
jgi:hypothetical protein